MTPANSQLITASRPRVGIPWRASDDEDKARAAGPAGKIGKTEDYLRAVEKAGGEGIVITLKDKEERSRLIPTLDAYVLPGSQADVEPGEYGSINRGLSAVLARKRLPAIGKRRFFGREKIHQSIFNL